MNNNLVNLLVNGNITYKEFSLCLFIEEREYTSYELADKLKVNRSNMCSCLNGLYKLGILHRNDYTKQFRLKE